MSDLDSLFGTFQRQLSDVLDTVIKTAAYEVTRLVEDNFLEEVKRRRQQVDTLTRQLEKAGRRRASGQEELGTTEILGSDVNKDGAHVETWTGGKRCELKFEADKQIAAPCPVTGSKEGGDLILAVNVKTEEEDERWSDRYHAGSCDARRTVMDGNPEAAVQCETTSTCDQNPQISSISTSVQDNLHVDSEPAQERDITRNFRITIKRPGRLHSQKPGCERDSVSLPKTSEGSAAQVKVHIRRDLPKSSDARLQSTDAAHVPIKQEIVVDKESCKVRLSDLQNTQTKSNTTSFSCLVNQIRVSLDEPKRSQKAQDRITLHSKVAAGFAVQQCKYPRKSFSNIAAQSQCSVVTLSPPRVPCVSKASSTSAPSVQPVHLHDKQTAVLNRTGVPWVLNRTQNLLLHSDSHPIQRHPLRCGQCGKCFPHPSSLKAHLRIHSDERPFCCSLCGRGFTKLSNLKAHRRVHTGEKPYCCSGCGKRFTQNCNLKRHQRVCDMGREGNI